MKKILLDTNAISSLFRGDEKVLEEIYEADRIYISIFVLGELFSGFKGGNKEKENSLLIKDFISKPTVKIINGTIETAEIFSEIKNQLKLKGSPLPINDIWIAAHSIETGSVLITYDKHFNHISGLRKW